MTTVLSSGDWPDKKARSGSFRAVPDDAEPGGSAPQPLRWRTRPPPIVGRKNLYQFVREFLWERGGVCERHELLSAMESEPGIAQRLTDGQGFKALIGNMRHSGYVVVDGDQIRATDKTARFMRGNKL